VTYRQERYVRQAVKSALAQTYTPLEIIISDDCSPDRTFEILEEEIRAYRGPHRVISKRHSQNTGMASNLNRAWELSSGEFIVIQSGDDISMPKRVEILVDAWRTPSIVDLVVSNVIVIDPSDREMRRGWPDPVARPITLSDTLREGWCYVLGCAVGHSRDLVARFGSIDPAVIQEDWVLPFRALVSRGIRVVDEPLVMYRQHGGNAWFGQQTKTRPTREQARRFAVNLLAIYREWLRAWKISGRVDDVGYERLVSLQRKCQYDVDCYDSTRVGALRLACRGLGEGLSLRQTLGLVKRHVLRYLSPNQIILHTPG
jgi:glycosyltransferase involved in cell wall biosynthesis